MSELDELIEFLSDQRPPVSTASPPDCASSSAALLRLAVATRLHSRLVQRCCFPTSPPLQIAQHAAELVQGLTGSPEGVARLAGKAGTLMPPLLRLVPGPANTSRAALVALVNLSQARLAEEAARAGR